jgi:hypothetical protein
MRLAPFLTCADTVTTLCTHIRPARRAGVGEMSGSWTPRDVAARPGTTVGG